MRETPRKSPAWLRIEGDVEALAGIVVHGDGVTAAQAAALLADMGCPPASDALLKCVERHAEFCRVESYDDNQLWPLLEAVNGVGRLRERRAVPALCRLLDADTKIPTHLRYRLEISVLRALVGIGAPEGTDLLLTRLAEKPGSEYVELAGELKDPDAVVPLLALLWNLLPGHGVRAMRALGSLRDVRTAPALLFLARSTASSPELRRAALEAHVRLPKVPWEAPRGSRDAVSQLWRLVHDPDRETARLAAVLQARTDDGRKSLISHLRFPFGGHGGPVPQSYPSQTAALAACTVVRENPGLFDDAELRPVLQRLLRGRETPRPLRQAAVEVLGVLGWDGRIDGLLDALGDDRINDAVAGVLAGLPEPPTRQLMGLLTGADGPQQRRGAAVALGLMRCTEAGPLLLEALDPVGPRSLRAAATDALGLLGHQPAAGPLEALVNDEAEARSLQARAVRALGRIGAPQSLAVLLSATRSPSEAVRLRAAEALGAFPITDVISRLGVMASEDDTPISRAAVQSLCQVGASDGLVLAALVEPASSWPVAMQQVLVAALAGCQGSVATAALGRLVDGPFAEEVQVSAINALGIRRDPESVAALIRFLDSRRTQYFWRGPAVLALARIGGKAAVKRVIAHFEDQRSFTSSGYRDQAREALSIIAADRVIAGATDPPPFAPA
ncbi:HEAT repeat domain-containing protein [Streptomyces chartreusis]|uniref:HEAT repeat domain-containing protein n=1 Tax=Streptomyces chartreusis TaxID=1969 RepID=UPI0036255F44